MGTVIAGVPVWGARYVFLTAIKHKPCLNILKDEYARWIGHRARKLRLDEI